MVLYDSIQNKSQKGFVMSIKEYFKFEERKTSYFTETLAGFTTFLTMAYIIILNPSVLSQTGMDFNGVFFATIIATIVGCLFMGIFANYPIAIAPGLAMNAYFSFVVVISMGIPWQEALGAVFISALIFLILSLTSFRQAVINAIPASMKEGISAGIGLFIAFIGLQGAKIVVADSSTLLTYVRFTKDFHTVGIGALLALIGLFITVILYAKNVKGSILIGILSTWILGMLCQLVGIYVPNPDTGFYSLYPTFKMIDITAIGDTFGQCFKADFSKIKILDFIVVLFAFLFVDIFDTLGTLIGVSTKAGMLDENEKLPRIKPALLADAIATSVGAVLGTSTTTTYVESSAGVLAGGRTGLSAAVTGIMFLLAIIFAPIFTAIPSFATAPALIFVGFLMISSIISVDFTDLTESVPAYLALLAMPLMYSISEGIALGVISYVVINVFCGKAKKVKPLMYILAVLFVCKYIFL